MIRPPTGKYFGIFLGQPFPKSRSWAMRLGVDLSELFYTRYEAQKAAEGATFILEKAVFVRDVEVPA